MTCESHQRQQKEKGQKRKQILTNSPLKNVIKFAVIEYSLQLSHGEKRGW
jgi:hypothetical protein